MTNFIDPSVRRQLALEQRVRRKLKGTNWTLKKSRGERQRTEVGDYWVFNNQHNCLVRSHVDLEEFLKELCEQKAPSTFL